MHEKGIVWFELTVSPCQKNNGEWVKTLEPWWTPNFVVQYNSRWMFIPQNMIYDDIWIYQYMVQLVLTPPHKWHSGTFLGSSSQQLSLFWRRVGLPGLGTTSQLLGAAQGPRMTFTDKSPILRFPALVMIQNVNLPAVLSESTGTRTMVSTLNYLLAREAAVTWLWQAWGILKFC